MPRRGFETAWTATPAVSSCATTSFQPELSAKAPWTRATVGRSRWRTLPRSWWSPLSVKGAAGPGGVAGRWGPRWRWSSARQEGQQVGVELFLVGAVETVRRPGVDLELGTLHQVDRLPSGRDDRHDLVVVPVRDERGDVDGLEVLGQV